MLGVREISGRRGTFVKLAALLALILVLSGISSEKTATAQKNTISPSVESRMESMKSGEKLTVIVELTGHAALPSPVPDGTVADKDRRQREVVRRLEAENDQSRSRLRPLLSRHEARGEVKEVAPLWISNSLAVTATPAAIRDLATSPEVAAITQNESIPAPAVPAATAPTPEPNLSAIDAPALWDLGYTGQGVVVANMDTGVDVTQPDLSARWRGGSDSWFDPSGEHPATPADANGHGTWTMGVMAGGSAGGTAVGVAPGAEWIAAKIFDDNDQATTAGIHRSFQWILDPDGDPATADAPDVVNSSWAMPSPGCDLEFQPDLQALLAAGIVPVFAAGNYGPNTGTAASPANYPEALAVGASDNAGTVQSFSSRGPSSCGEPQGTPQGTPQSTFPEVVAPGLDIKAPDLLGGYAYASGTSLAAPHAAGALALLLDADPSLTAAQQREALTASATDVGAAGPDDASGYGLINARSAYDYVRANFWSVPPDTTPPVISADPAPPASSSVNGAQSVALSSDGGEKVRYTTDGTVPDYTSKLYDGTRINITQTATIRAYAIDAAGNRADASFSYTVRQPTAITLDATRTRLDFGQGTTLSGTLTSNGAPLARKTVEIEQRPIGTSAFVSVPNGAVETGADGRFSLPGVKPHQNTEYRAVFAEQPELQSCAMGRRVDVRVLVSAKLSASTVRPGRGVTISGYVRPSHTGSVEVEIKHGGAVVKRKTASLNGDSHYSLSFTPRPVGKYAVSVSYAGHTDHLGGVSPARHFLVSG